MHEIRQGERAMWDDKTTITTYARYITRGNVLEAEAGTTGYRADISSRRGRSYFRIEDAGGTDIAVAPIHDKYGRPSGFEVELYGNDELETMIMALKFITKVLEEESSEDHDIKYD